MLGLDSQYPEDNNLSHQPSSPQNYINNGSFYESLADEFAPRQKSDKLMRSLSHNESSHQGAPPSSHLEIKEAITRFVK
jgi:hypothetical protein